MKRFLLFLFVLTVTLMGTFDLALADVPMDELLYNREKAPQVEVTQDGQKLHFEVAGQVYSVDVFPKREQMKVSLGLKLPPEIIAQLQARGEPIPPEANPLESYQSLPQEQKNAFLKERLEFLKKTASVLHGTSYVSGMGSLIGDQLSYVGKKIKSVFGDQPESLKGDQGAPTFQERRAQVVQNMLQAIDYKLWYQAPLFIDSNEVGLQAHLGMVAVQGLKKNGAGGAEFLGISIGYNKTDKSFVFEVYHNSERFDHTKAAVGVIGMNFFAGPFFSHRDAKSPAKNMKGFTFYPPVAPGATQYGPDIFSTGVASGIGFPPPPIADMYTWTDRFERRTVFRIAVSPILPGFVRLHVGDVKGSVRGLVLRVSDALVILSKKILPLQRRSCQAVFATN